MSLYKGRILPKLLYLHFVTDPLITLQISKRHSLSRDICYQEIFVIKRYLLSRDLATHHQAKRKPLEEPCGEHYNTYTYTITMIRSFSGTGWANHSGSDTGHLCQLSSLHVWRGKLTPVKYLLCTSCSNSLHSQTRLHKTTLKWVKQDGTGTGWRLTVPGRLC